MMPSVSSPRSRDALTISRLAHCTHSRALQHVHLCASRRRRARRDRGTHAEHHPGESWGGQGVGPRGATRGRESGVARTFAHSRRDPQDTIPQPPTGDKMTEEIPNDGITSYTTEPATTGTRGPSKRGVLDITASSAWWSCEAAGAAAQLRLSSLFRCGVRPQVGRE